MQLQLQALGGQGQPVAHVHGLMCRPGISRGYMKSDFDGGLAGQSPNMPPIMPDAYAIGLTPAAAAVINIKMMACCTEPCPQAWAVTEQDSFTHRKCVTVSERPLPHTQSRPGCFTLSKVVNSGTISGALNLMKAPTANVAWTVSEADIHSALDCCSVSNNSSWQNEVVMHKSKAACARYC